MIENEVLGQSDIYPSRIFSLPAFFPAALMEADHLAVGFTRILQQSVNNNIYWRKSCAILFLACPVISQTNWWAER